MNLKKLEVKRNKLGIQLRILELDIIIKVLEKKPLNFLVFGLGNDTPLWLEVNEGRTVFLEDLGGWFTKVTKKFPKAEAYIVKYKTIRKDWKKWLKDPKKLLLNLPIEISDIKWDVILVDGPRGYEDTNPGRMQSIYTASKIIRRGGHVFVHDCGREVEAVYSDKFLKEKNLIGEIQSIKDPTKPINVDEKGLRHYHIKG